MTLWVGIFDPRRMSLDYIDAGHGYAMLLKTNKSIQELDEKGGVPIGVDINAHYESASVIISSEDQVIVFSDGIVEQTNDEVLPDGQPQQFGKQGVCKVIETYGGNDLLQEIFAALKAFAGGKRFTDDITGVLVQCDWQK